jgi:hypothetical protein
MIRSYPGLLNPGRIELDVRSVKPGNYLILISDAERKGVAKFLKQ